MLGRDEHEARQLQRVDMRREHRQPDAVAAGEVDLDAVDAAEHEALAGERDLVPAPACGELVQAAVVLLHVGADAQVPLRSLDQSHGVVATPAQPVLDLDRREGRLAGVAPVDVPGPAIHQAGVEQLQEQPLRPAVHDRIGAEEGALPVEGEAESLQLGGHVLGAALDPVAGRLAARDRAELGGKAEGVEAEVEQDAIAASPAEAGVRVADRVAADVADVDVPRGERGGGLDVEVRLVVDRSEIGQRRRPERVALAPGRLATGLDRIGLIARVDTVVHVDRAYPRALAAV